MKGVGVLIISTIHISQMVLQLQWHEVLFEEVTQILRHPELWFFCMIHILYHIHNRTKYHQYTSNGDGDIAITNLYCQGETNSIPWHTKLWFLLMTCLINHMHNCTKYHPYISKGLGVMAITSYIVNSMAPSLVILDHDMPS